MRGLIGANGEEVSKEKEDLRTELLLQGLEHEALIESRRAWMQVSAPLPVIPQDGKVVGGPGLNLKLDAYYDYVEQLVPYVPSQRPQEAAEPTPEALDSERNDLVNAYKEMVASGQL